MDTLIITYVFSHPLSNGTFLLSLLWPLGMLLTTNL